VSADGVDEFGCVFLQSVWRFLVVWRVGVERRRMRARDQQRECAMRRTVIRAGEVMSVLTWRECRARAGDLLDHSGVRSIVGGRTPFEPPVFCEQNWRVYLQMFLSSRERWCKVSVVQGLWKALCLCGRVRLQLRLCQQWGSWSAVLCGTAESGVCWADDGSVVRASVECVWWGVIRNQKEAHSLLDFESLGGCFELEVISWPTGRSFG